MAGGHCGGGGFALGSRSDYSFPLSSFLIDLVGLKQLANPPLVVRNFGSTFIVVGGERKWTTTINFPPPPPPQ